MPERVLGGFLGHAIGDVLGFPYEGIPRRVLKVRPITDVPDRVMPSDDTALVLCTAQNLCERGIDPEDLARRLVGWLEKGECTPNGKAVGVGRTTYEAVKRIASGIPPLMAGGRGERDNGNGSLMRMLPLIFYLYGRPETEVKEVVRAYSSITHAHMRSVIACHTYVLFGMYLYGGSTPHEAYGKVAEKIRAFYRGEEELRHFSRILDGSLPDLREKDVRSGGYVVHTLEASLWVLIRGGSFRDMVLRAVNLGGDTDTVGAIVGGLAGIYHTVRGIPKEWINRLPMREELERVAVCLAERSATGR